jgi:aminomethyltransferase
VGVPDGLKLTPFHQFTPPSIDEFIDVYGYAVPLWITDPASEYDAIRSRVGMLEFSMLYKWDIEGPGALGVADAVFSRDVASMSSGQIAYGVVTDANGLMVDDCTTMVHGPDHVRMFGGNPESLHLLAEACGPGTTVSERRNEWAVLSVQGPNSRTLLQRLTDHDLSNEAFPYYTFKTNVPLTGTTAQINRLGFTAELGFEVMVPVDAAEAIWVAVNEAGEDLGLQACAAAALMMCRVEAGMIMGELEYDHTVSPYECRMGWAVDLEKGPWLGRDALKSRKDRDTGRVVTVRVDAAPELAEGARLRSEEGADVGHITMAVPSPVLDGATIGLARVHREAAKSGTKLVLSSTDDSAAVEVIPTPVYDPERVRVRS